MELQPVPTETPSQTSSVLTWVDTKESVGLWQWGRVADPA